MKKYSLNLVMLAIALIVITPPWAHSAGTKCLDFYSDTTTDLRNFTGKPFFHTMQTLRREMDNASLTPFRIVAASEILEKAKAFHPEAYGKILKIFLNSADARELRRNPRMKEKAEAGLVELVKELEGREVSSIPLDELDQNNRVPYVAVAIKRAMEKLGIHGNILQALNLATFLSIASGEGSKVYVNDQNFFVNVGYELDRMDRAEKSGRSSSTSPEAGFNDATDTFLLTSLHKQLNQTAPNSAQFYRSMLELLVKSNSDNYSKLTEQEQGNLTDFLAVYTAEFRRSMMSDLKMHRWMDDLAEVYFISGYGSRAGKVVNQHGFTDGEAKTYFAVGANGSGIGVMRGYRRHLQAHVTMAVRELKPELIEKIESLMGQRISNRSDVFHDFMIFINKPQNQRKVEASGTELVNAMTDLMTFVSKNHAAITPIIETRITPDDPVIVRENKILESKRKAREAKNNGQ